MKTTKDVARITGYSERYIRQLAAKGVLPSARQISGSGSGWRKPHYGISTLSTGR